jgi:hypothetical protein
MPDIRSKPATKEFRDNFDRTFRGKEEEPCIFFTKKISLKAAKKLYPARRTHGSKNRQNTRTIK